MSIVHKSLAGISADARQHTPPTNQHQNEDATVKVAGGFARWLLHHPLREDTKPLAGNLVHYAFGASVGALYGGSPPSRRASPLRPDCHSASPYGSARTS